MCNNVDKHMVRTRSNCCDTELFVQGEARSTSALPTETGMAAKRTDWEHPIHSFPRPQSGQCYSCGCCFRTQWELKKHYEDNPSHRPPRQPRSNNVVGKSNGWERTVCKQYAWRCTFCGIVFPSRPTLVRHYQQFPRHRLPRQ
jgi:hypothetical protein